MAKRVGKQKTQLPTCYFDGYLEKRSFKDKTSRKLWACLCGSTLFFFNEKKDADYIEKLDLCEFVSITDDSSQDKNLDAARFNLVMKEGNVKITAPNAEARELWKGFILSVAELYVPSSLNLLPGQIHMLKNAVEKEKERIKKLPSTTTEKFNPYSSIKLDMPACYHKLTRLEAEVLLDREAKRGNLLLRPGSDGSFAISTRQDFEGSVFRHYRVTRKPTGGYVIDVNNPVDCATLHDVITYLVDKTDGVFIPLILEDQYAKHFSFICSDNENGEMSLQQGVLNSLPPDVPPRPDMLKIPDAEETPVDAQDDTSSVVHQAVKEKHTEKPDSSAMQLPDTDKKTMKKPILPPSPVPRKVSSVSMSTITEHKVKTSLDSNKQMPAAALFELKQKLELKQVHKAKCLE